MAVKKMMCGFCRERNRTVINGKAGHRLSRAVRFVALLLALSAAFACVAFAASSDSPYTARPSANGRLHVEGTALADASGRAVQLRGVSTHGLTWYPDYLNGSLFGILASDWNCNLVRLAMYSELYAGSEREESLRLMRRGIDAAIEADLYVLVDWHILNDADPNENLACAAEFFETITKEYADCPNLIFEICNEPNGSTGWDDVRTYCEQIIPVIRNNIPDAVIVVGTPEYDRNLGDPILQPLAFKNVMYVLHFYTATHHEGLFSELKAAVDAGLPVFISECGVSEASGDGRIDFGWAAEWFSYLLENDISYAVWSLSDKAESSAFFVPGFDPYGDIEDKDLTIAGKWVRDLIRGKDPRQIESPAAAIEKSAFSRLQSEVRNSIGERGGRAVSRWLLFALVSAGAVLLSLLIGMLRRRSRKQKRTTYDDIIREGENGGEKQKKHVLPVLLLLLSVLFTLIYLGWRVVFSVPTQSGAVAVGMNLLLLAVEVLGFFESLMLYRNLFGMKAHPLPSIPEEEYPDVDIFIATYNEPPELLRRTLNGCVHMKYPDRSKVHIWLCDDNRRPEMRVLAEQMGVGYFDRPDNEGAKAGNLNHALGLTSAPYIVTFDADMIPKSDFLLKTIPYFVDVELREKGRPEKEWLHLGLLQTPQCFYDPDVFQHALYSEKRAPNEQDFFYRTIEPSKTATNSVIYGGSNTVLSRRALADIGGFFTGSITEDFATGLLIEAAGYVSLALPEPLASGQTPHTFGEHIKQRTRWGRGVIATARKLKLSRMKTLTPAQKVNYESSVVYWYSPIKNLIYMISPLLYAVFAVPVFRCSWLELMVFWLPMFVLQDAALRVNSRGTISSKWSGIYETSVMPHLLIPILKEMLGITLSKFKVTDKSGRTGARKRDVRAMVPFLILTALSAAGILRLVLLIGKAQLISLLILLFWIIRNLYFLIMALFLIDGRDSDGEPVKVADAELVSVQTDNGTFGGITTLLTEHNVTVYLDDEVTIALGDRAKITIDASAGEVSFTGAVTGISVSRSGAARTYTMEILDLDGKEAEYWQVLYDRIPTLPQSLHRDFGVIPHLWQNIAHRVARTRK